MTKLALRRESDNTIIEVFPNEEPRWFEVPGVGKASPPAAGWRGHGYVIDRVVPPEPAPDGMRRVGRAKYVWEQDTVVEKFDHEPIPEPKILTPAEKVQQFLEAIDVTAEEFMTELNRARPTART